MNRRRLLVGVGVLASPLLAGCLGDEGSSGSKTATSTDSATPSSTTATSGPTSTESPTTESPTTGAESSSPSPSPSPTESTESTTKTETETTATPPTRTRSPSGTPDRNWVVDRGIEVRDRACGTAEEGTITFEEGAVVATGTITGSDGCATAMLDEVTYDRATNRLRVVVATGTNREAGTVCAQCLTVIEYEATVRFEGQAPERVVLVHRGATGETRVETATA